MTDLEKAKQWLDSKEPSFGGDEVWTITRRNMAEVLAEYASHSNSELLERVQKLEQALLHLRDIRNFYGHEELARAERELLDEIQRVCGKSHDRSGRETRGIVG